MENSLCPPCATVSKFSKYVGQRVTLPPSQKNFIADLDGLEHTKKIVKMSKVWDELNSHLTCYSLIESMRKWWRREKVQKSLIQEC